MLYAPQNCAQFCMFIMSLLLLGSLIQEHSERKGKFRGDSGCRVCEHIMNLCLQAVKHAEEEAAREVQGLKDATTSGIEVAAQATNTQQPEKKAVDKLIDQIQRSDAGIAAL